MAGVSSRTRSKNVPLFGSIPFHGSCSCSLKTKRRRSDIGLSSKKRKPNEESFVLHEQVNVICIDIDEEGDKEGLKFSEGCVEQVDNVDNGDADEVGDEDWLEYLNKNKFEVDDIDVKNEEQSGDIVGEGGLEDGEINSFEACVDVENEVESEDNGGIGELVVKDESFHDEKCGSMSENPIIDSDDDLDECDESEESEEIETSDEEFQVDEVDEVSDDDGDNSEEKEAKKKGWKKEEVVVEEKVEKEVEEEEEVGVEKEVEEEEVVVEEEVEKDVDLEMVWQEYDNVLEEMVREAKGQNSNIEEVKIDNSPSSVNNNKLEHPDDGNARSSNALNKKGSFVPMEAPSSSKLHQASETLTSKGVQMGSEDEEDEEEEEYKEVDLKKDWQEYDNVLAEMVREAKGQHTPSSVNNDELEHANDGNVRISNVSHGDNVYVGKSKTKSKAKVTPKESVIISDFDEEKIQPARGLGIDDGIDSSIHTKQKEMKSSEKQKMTEMKGRDYKGRASTSSGEKKESMELRLNQRGKSTVFMPKELRLVELLAEYYWGNKNNKIQNDSPVLEMKDVIRHYTRPPPVSNVTAPLIWSLKMVEKVQKTKNEKEEEVLWDQIDTTLRELEAESMIGNLGTNEATQKKIGSPFSECEHDIYLDEEIGVYCRRCGWVVTDIKDVSPQVVDKFPYEGSGQRASFGDANVSHFHDSHFNVSEHDSETNFSYDERTVWDLIPDVKQTLYSHQQEGFEFIWNKLVGNIEIQGLKNANLQREGGCIISHAPGTGKTKLTIMFLKAYLKVFPKCLPVIVAPAGLLLTWEDEFKKWDIGVPFHNLNNPELSVKELDDVVNATNWSNSQRHSTDETRMAKLISWFKETSILGISYSLFKELAGGEGALQKRKENSYMRKALLEAPGLLVLDEGHTPRNARSRVWKVLSKIQTKKRIMLSGTPFQNNFLELYNTFSIVKPSFPKTIPLKLKKFCQKRKKAGKKWSWEPVTGNSTTGHPSDDKIKHLKLLMDPFVHVYKGAILQKKLPGLRDCVLSLRPDSFQKQILESIQSSQDIFNFERKLIMASVHPSLFLECKLLKKEESVVDREQLEKLRLSPHVGVKTKFLVEFVNLCVAVNEKVLVFSQFTAPLRLIVEQFNSSFNWTEGKEMLYMDGKVDLKEKQSLIHNFNDANSKAKILLACTKACSEGISLVGASRVVLLDVVWNPSVERQAISRAYRIGQKRVVYTYHLLTHETTECLKYFKQAEKDRLSELVFSDNNKGKNRAGNIEDGILDLMLQHEKLKDMFVECVVQPKERDLVESYYY
ncbi:SNF2 domain-containing protein CLASSY 4-like [Vicia villosa]|uniref:SNF2 domain-containing protein CLASSY 4-like n=1 Tax=Vicia villosa TaxID=3911 RepID=UPI00273AFB94|nr:SNF2 domain-containing protein CLASSY 4-like [Vicia villosa]